MIMHDRNTIHVPSHVIPAHAAEILGVDAGIVDEMIDSGKMAQEIWQGWPYIPMCEVIRILNERRPNGNK